MAADEMQVHLTAKDDLTRELKNTVKYVAKLEAQLKDLGDATSPEAERDVARLTRQLDKAYDKSRTLSGAVGTLDDKLDQMGYSASSAARKTDGLRRDMDRTHRSSMTLAGGWGKMLGVVAGVTAAVSAAGFAFRFLGDSINEARQARKAMAQTAAVMKSMGRSESPQVLNEMIDSLEAISGIDGDNIRQMTNVLLTFGKVTGDTFTQANELALDLSVAFGKDLQSSAVMVGKALNDPIKGLTNLGRIGVQFTAGQEKQIKAFMATNDLAGAQAIILKELTRQVAGSAAAQADGLQKTQVAWGNFKEEVGRTLLETASAMATMSDVNPAEGLQQASQWIRDNRKQIVQTLMQIAGWTLKFASATARLGQVNAVVYGNLLVQLGALIKVLGFLGKSDTMMKFGDDLAQTGADAVEAAGGLGDLATSLDTMGTNALDAAAGLDAVRTSWQALKDAGASPKVIRSSRNIPIGGDTTVGMGTGTLGAGGLAAYHGAYSSALGGHSIMSGVRATGLGSVHSDHRYGRAMDIQGPRLGAYAQVVRRNGGYAAMHGAGGNRHLHVVPQTRRPQQHASGGNTFHADVTVVGPQREMDIQGAVARGLRDAARQTRERG